MKTVVLSILVVCGLAGGVQAETRTVPSDYPDIQSAIDASQHGDTVLVLPGVYFESINFKGKNITVTGTDPNDAGVVGYTVINADGKGAGVTFESGETSQAVLTGFTITKGTGTSFAGISSATESIYAGGGVCCNNSSPTITKNVIVRNTPAISIDATSNQVTLCVGGGIGGFYASPTITYNTIRTNTAYIGGGIGIYMGTPTIHDNIIFDNAAYMGGGVLTFAGSMHNNTIVHNSCDYGQELGLTNGLGGNCYFAFGTQYGTLQVFNNVFCNATTGNGVSWEGDISTGVFAFNDVWGNLPGNYGLDDQTNKSGNISADPRFRSVSGRDYHLTLESPCINAGDPEYVPAAGETDIDGEARVFGARIDMGADEYVGYVKPVAMAGLDMHVLTAMTPVPLDGSGSFFYDPTGVVSYRWKQVSGPAGTFDDPNSAAPVFTPQAEGTYVLQLVVSDDRYSSTADQLTIFVGPNRAPVADCGPDKAVASPGYARLDGSRSADPDPVDHLHYSWRQVNGPAVVLAGADTVSPSFMAQPGEQYSFELVVNDGFTDSAPSQVTVTGVQVSQSYLGLNASTANGDPSNDPDVSGSRVVFTVGSGTAYQWRIGWKDYLTQEAGAFSSGMSLHPRIDGDLVVWSGGPTSASTNGLECTSVFIRNLATDTPNTLRARSDTQSFSHPAISGHTAVWVQHVGINRAISTQWLNMPYDICGADVTNLGGPVYFTIAEKVGRRDPFPYQSPALDLDRVVDISGKIVVWEGDGDIYAADISNLSDIKVFPVCKAPGRQYSPAVSGKYVVWTDQRNDEGDIYGADISDPQNVKVFEVAGGKGVQQQPAIDGCMVFYVEGKSTGQIKGTCITARYGILDGFLPTLNGLSPVVDGTTVVWLSGSLGYAQGIRLSFGYSALDGQVVNQTTGKRYDYVQHAVACANPADEIVVPAGVYQEKIHFAGKSLVVRSSDPNDPAVVAATILQGDGIKATFAEGETETCVLDGFTVTGGYQGVFCYGGSPTIRNCVIKGHSGAGVRLLNLSKPPLTRCRIVGNGGNGVDMYSAITLRAMSSNVPTLTNCIVAGNRLAGLRGGQPNLMNCTIVENLKEGINCSLASIINSIVFSNGGAEVIVASRGGAGYSDVEGGISGTGNIKLDPQFASSGRWTETGWVEGDYHLKSQGWRWNPQAGVWTSDDVTSPCIDAGSPSASLLDEPVTIPGVPDTAVVNLGIDMGAYGGTSQASVKRAAP
jgi:beta propeller repeat protein